MKKDDPRGADGIFILNTLCKGGSAKGEGSSDVRLLYYSLALGQREKYIPFLRQETYIPPEGMYSTAKGPALRGKIYGEII